MQFIQYMYLNPKDVYHICLYACISSLPFSNWNQENKLERIKRFAPIFFYLFVVSLERICRKSENSIYMPISKNLTCSLQKITAESNFEHQQRINVGFWLSLPPILEALSWYEERFVVSHSTKCPIKVI